MANWGKKWYSGRKVSLGNDAHGQQAFLVLSETQAMEIDKERDALHRTRKARKAERNKSLREIGR